MLINICCAVHVGSYKKIINLLFYMLSAIEIGCLKSNHNNSLSTAIGALTEKKAIKFLHSVKALLM